MKEELFRTQNEISDLADLSDFAYENIFSMYKDDEYYGYNILKAIRLPDELHPDTFTYVRITGKVSWTSLSFSEYRTIRLWWLLCVTNGILNPVILPEPGTVIKVINPTYVREVLDQIKLQVANQ